MIRDEVEDLIRAWDAYERRRGAPAVIDFDYAPPGEVVAPAASRWQVLTELARLRGQADEAGDRSLAAVVGAHVTYLRALLGERLPLGEYVQHTQGCAAGGWPQDYVMAVGDRARDALDDLGVAWDPGTGDALAAVEGAVPAAEVPQRIAAAAAELDADVRALVGTTAGYDLAVVEVDEDAYWSYWLDGAGQRLRLRLNRRTAVFTEVLVRQFALHEVLGHALQAASLAGAVDGRDDGWVRLSGVHDPRQMCFEGLATALPLFVAPDDRALVARVRLDHYLHLVRAELHRGVNAGQPLADLVALARRRVPYWTDATIGDLLTDRGADPRLRSYLWSYPAGTDWFVTLADHRDPATTERVLRAAYQRPLTPTDLVALWPASPRPGGPGAALRLREPALP